MKYLKYCLPTLGQSWIILALTILGQLLASVALLPFTMKGLNQGWLTLMLPYLLTFVLPLLYIVLNGRSRAREAEVTGEEEPEKIDKTDFGGLHPILFLFAVVVSCYAVSIALDPFNIWMPAPEWFQSMMEQITAGTDFVWSFITVAILAPILEELVCRGIICRGLLARYKNPWSAIIWSALIFAVMHLNPWQGIPAFLLGVWFGWIYYRTGSLKSTMFLHFVNNGSVVLIGHFYPAFAAQDSISAVFASMELYWMATALSVAVFIIANCLLLNRFLPKKQQIQ